MALIDDLFNNIVKGLGMGPDAPQTVAQARITHTPIAYQQRPASTPSAVQAQYVQNKSWDQYAGPRDMPPTGIQSSQPGYIQVFNQSQPYYLPHEIIHAATIPELEANPKIKANVGRLIPQDVTDTVKENYEGHYYDPVHEGVSWLLTSPFFADKKYDDARLKVINAFTPSTRGKVTRILGDLAAKQGATQ